MLGMLIELTSMLRLVAATDQPKPGCRSTCGNLNISFPFGTSPDCYLNENFLITCNDTHYDPPQPFLRTGNAKVLDLKLDGHIKISSFVAKSCYNATGAPIIDFNSNPQGFSFSSYTISSTDNKFTVVGCDTYAYIRGLKTNEYNVGCISLCDRLDSIEDGECSGIGCCRASVPVGIKNLTMSLYSLSNYTRVNNFSSCGYAFVTEAGFFNFSSAVLKDLQNKTDFPMVLDYAIGKSTCAEAKKNKSSYACRSENSDCQDSQTGQGYLCNCSKGFEGNPYLIGNGSCQGILLRTTTINPFLSSYVV